MIEPGTLLDICVENGIRFYAGVPCSFLTTLLNRLLARPDLRYVGAANEADAVALCAGAWLAGTLGATLLQNSGLGNAVNPLTSLNVPHRIPLLLVTTWRGEPNIHDEPQHKLMGKITETLLDLMGIPHWRIPPTQSLLAEVVQEAMERIRGDEMPAALVAKKDAFEDWPAEFCFSTEAFEKVECSDFTEGSTLPSRLEILASFLEATDSITAVISTTGKCSRELYTLADRVQHFYLVGAMGSAVSVGLGVALNSRVPVAVLDGDGSLLMKMGALATVGAYAPANVTHILLDNAAHDSTGGQPTVSSKIDFAGIAQSCGYKFVARCDSVRGFQQAFAKSRKVAGPHFMHVRIAKGSLRDLARPNVPPDQIARRFRHFLTSFESR